ncbi:hypothetical protein Bhyg_02700 [Pseudolycoriella hygida]|uniref:Uncharacterized protein n=1 Tax=Pseudolycoriella hygida TaxID=35572 RepID=A0A9Q0NBY0_9DIPT|nr:hypothetical protein Bhyg_02700 [Pseudolycoriella hygida]
MFTTPQIILNNPTS